MHPTVHVALHTPSFRLRRFMGVAWSVILAKCVFVTWAVQHWHMPFRASWVVVPTLVFAALVTGLWISHREEA